MVLFVLNCVRTLVRSICTGENRLVDPADGVEEFPPAADDEVDEEAEHERDGNEVDVTRAEQTQLLEGAAKNRMLYIVY